MNIIKKGNGPPMARLLNSKLALPPTPLYKKSFGRNEEEQDIATMFGSCDSY